MENRWTDIMVDLETTGTAVESASIIQLSAVMFNLSTGEVGPSFDACLKPITSWDKNTLRWWLSTPEKQQILASITERAEEPHKVINDFYRWNRTIGPATHFWSKPSHFDYSLLAKYFTLFGYKNPFAYWKARDMRSYILGLVFPEELPDLIYNSSNAHNALADVTFQVRELIRITKERKDEIIEHI